MRNSSDPPVAPNPRLALLLAAVILLLATPVPAEEAELINSGEVIHSGWAVEWGQLPAVVRQNLSSSHDTDTDPSDLIPMQLSLVAYELETRLDGGLERELFVDAMGRDLLVVETMDEPGSEDDEEDQPESDDRQSGAATRVQIDELPEAVREALFQLWPGPFSELEYELEWGAGVLAAEWQQFDFEYEAKILADGGLLYQEVPNPEPLPKAVIERAQRLGVPVRRIETLLIRAYALADRDSGNLIGPYVLGTGRALDH